jgi:hypothetical protein
VALVNKVSNAIMTFELFVFHHIAIVNAQAMKPLTCWKEHVERFLNVSFFALQILRILGLQIEIETFD